ncbi:MAG: hypothetical protein GWP06_12765 [Actinobacteria bacterium]|nr:hypothetical protein [Actinomycetota bacterium]
MNKTNLLKIIVIFLSVSFFAEAKSQGTESWGSEYFVNKMRLPILPNDKGSIYFSLNDEIAILIERVTNELNLYDIATGVLVDSTFETLDSTITKKLIIPFDQLQDFREAIVVAETNISQQGVPPNKETYFSSSQPIFTGKDKKAYTKNVRTDISVLAYFFNIETGESLGALAEKVIYVGGSREKSKAKALKKLQQKIFRDLKRIYWISYDIASSEKGKITVIPDTAQVIKKGILFELVEPDRMQTKDDKEYTIPGGVVGFATVTDSSHLKILHQWRNFGAGSWVVEHPDPIRALQLSVVPPITQDYLNYGLHFQVAPIRSLDWGFGVQISRVTDSMNKNDYGFGFSGFAIWRFLNGARMDIGTKVGMDMDILFRKDDNEEVVNTVLFSAQAGLLSEIPFSPNLDFVVNVGYRFGFKTDTWEYSVDDDTFPAFWENDIPRVDNSGFVFSVGFKYLLF